MQPSIFRSCNGESVDLEESISSVSFNGFGQMESVASLSGAVETPLADLRRVLYLAELRTE